MIIYYLLGAWVGMHYFESFTKRRSNKQAIIALFVFIACCLFNGLENLLPTWVAEFKLQSIVNLVSCGSFWVMLDVFNIKKCPDYMRDSFLIYAMHSLVGAMVSKIIYMILPNGEQYLLITAVIAFPVTVIIICVFGKLIGQFLPWLKKILSGR